MGSPSLKDTRVLLVDDEPDFREAMAFYFQRLGCKVFMAKNGRDAFNIVQEQPVDVVISDIRMPGGDGVEFLDRVKALCPQAPIILLVTGFTDVSTEEILNKGAEALICKPFDQKSLQETVLRLLTPPEERWSRITSRIDVDLTVELRFANMEEAIKAKVANIGRGGLFISFDQQKYPNVNDSLSFTIKFKDSFPIEGTGVVRWVRIKSTEQFPSGCGIEFTSLGESERKWILDFINNHKLTAYIPNK
jgi:CheY-like chemotaxis protein